MPPRKKNDDSQSEGTTKTKVEELTVEAEEAASKVVRRAKAPVSGGRTADDRLLQARATLKTMFSKANTEDPVVAIDSDSLTASIPHLPTGSLILDYLIGGRKNSRGVMPCPGLPKGKIINLYGHESSGKTTLALTAAATTIQNGGLCCYIDWEHEIVPAYAQSLGVPSDPSKFLLFQPQTMEDGLKIIWQMATLGIELIVIDSAGAPVPADQAAATLKDQGKVGQPGVIARYWSAFLAKIKPIIDKTGSTVIGISQMRKNFNATTWGGDNATVQGGDAWKFYSAVRMRLQRVETEVVAEKDALTLKETKRPTGLIIEAKLDKCKVSPSQGAKQRFYIKFGEGIDDMRSVLEIAQAHGIIKGKPWMTFEMKNGQQVRGQGREAFRAAVLNTPGAWAELSSAVIAKIGEGGKVIEAKAELDGDAAVDLAEDFLADVRRDATGGAPEDQDAESESPEGVTDLDSYAPEGDLANN